MPEQALQPRTEATQDDPEQSFLRALGLRVRRRRESSGYTRKALALHAGLSERYLAQLELGSGNVSMLLLRKLAVALECELTELIAEEKVSRPSERPGMSQVTSILRHLDDEQLSQVATILDSRYGEATAMRQSRIALIGLRGAGKSTVGPLLAKRLGMRFIELDSEIEKELGTELAGIFSIYGQDAYREAEAKVLDRLTAQEHSYVLATGGSLVTESTTYTMLRSRCFTVWLSASPEDHMKRVVAQGDLRPMLGRDQAMTELQNILRQRESLYRLADIAMNTSRLSCDDIVDGIIQDLS